MNRENCSEETSDDSGFGLPYLQGDAPEHPMAGAGHVALRDVSASGTRVLRANPFRLAPSVFFALFSGHKERITRIEVSEVWVYVTLGWHQTFLWHRGQVRFRVDARRKTITVDSFGERVELSCPYFSRALMAEVEQSLPNLI